MIDTKGTYSYRVSAVNGWGETIAGPPTSQVPTPGITVSWPEIPGAIGYNIYRAVAPPRRIPRKLKKLRKKRGEVLYPEYRLWKYVGGLR